MYIEIRVQWTLLDVAEQTHVLPDYPQLFLRIHLAVASAITALKKHFPSLITVFSIS